MPFFSAVNPGSTALAGPERTGRPSFLPNRRTWSRRARRAKVTLIGVVLLFWVLLELIAVAVLLVLEVIMVVQHAHPAAFSSPRGRRRTARAYYNRSHRERNPRLDHTLPTRSYSSPRTSHRIISNHFTHGSGWGRTEHLSHLDIASRVVYNDVNADDNVVNQPRRPIDEKKWFAQTSSAARNPP